MNKYYRSIKLGNKVDLIHFDFGFFELLDKNKQPIKAQDNKISFIIHIDGNFCE